MQVFRGIGIGPTEWSAGRIPRDTTATHSELSPRPLNVRLHRPKLTGSDAPLRREPRPTAAEPLCVMLLSPFGPSHLGRDAAPRPFSPRHRGVADNVPSTRSCAFHRLDPERSMPSRAAPTSGRIVLGGTVTREPPHFRRPQFRSVHATFTADRSSVPRSLRVAISVDALPEADRPCDLTPSDVRFDSASRDGSPGFSPP